MKKKIFRSVSIFLACLFVFSAAVSTTLGWQSLNQSVKNETKIRQNTVSVELLKLEKKADGTLTEIPVSGAVFYLFQESGEQIGGAYRTDKAGKIAVSLPSGHYYFEEQYPIEGYRFEEETAGVPKTKYPFSVTGEETEPVRVTAYNIRTEGALTLQKIVKNANGDRLTAAQLAQEFVFTVTFSDGGTYDYRIDGGALQSVASGGTLRLKHGQTAVFESMPTGTLYTVVEAPVSGYQAQANGHRGNIMPSGNTAVFTNTYAPLAVKTGSLAITKEIKAANGGAVDTTKNFSFVVTFSNGGLYTYRIDGGELQSLASGEALVLKHGQTALFEKLPLGVDYTVTEQPTAGYLPLVEQYAGKITAQGILLPFVNVPETGGSLPGNLTVTKEVVGEHGDPNQAFTFEVIFTGENAPASPQIFTLKAGESFTIPDILPGTHYAVTETDTAGYLALSGSASGTIAAGQETAVTFRNQAPDPKDAAEICVTKEVQGDYPKEDQNKAFAFTITINGQKTDFTLTPGQRKIFKASLGDIYEVREANYFGDGYSQTFQNGLGVADKKTVEVLAVNTYVGRPVVSLEGNKTWVLGKAGPEVLPKSITVQLKNGDLLVEEQEVRPDENGAWKYRFIAPKYDRDGKEIAYTVEEAPVDGFKVSYNGLNIINTYLAPVEMDPPILEKTVAGENAPKTRFEFWMRGEEGAPMPEGAVGDTKILTLDGAGTVELGTIRFTKPGVYTYTVTELNGGAKNWTYDDARYTLTMTVTEKDGVLAIARELKKNSEPANTFAFHNVYDEKTTPPLEDTMVVAGTKTWQHGDNPKENRPNAIVVYVYADNELTLQRQVTEADGWQYRFELPRCARDGHEIVYTVGEEKVEGYDTKINGYNLVNTYTGEPIVPGGPPLTGDYSHLEWYLALMAVSGISLAVLLLIRLREKKREKKGF